MQLEGDDHVSDTQLGTPFSFTTRSGYEMKVLAVLLVAAVASVLAVPVVDTSAAASDESVK